MSNIILPPPNKKKLYLSGSIIVLLTMVFLGYFLIQLANIKKDTPSAVYGIDFIAYYTAAQQIEAGEASEIYTEITGDFSVADKGKFFETARKSGFHLTPTRYVYLPIFLVPFTLLTKFSFPVATTLWLILNLFAVITIIFLEWSFTKDLPHPILRLMVIIFFNLSSFPLLYALKLGQTSIIVYLLICLIYWLTLKNRDIPAGILLGLITALKYSPLLFILYFFYRRRYTLVILSLLTALSLLVLSIALYGLPLHTIYWDYIRELSHIGIAAWSNQSLDAFLLRLFTKTHILHFDPLKAPLLISIIRYTITLSVLGIVYLCLRGGKRSHDNQLYSLEFSALTLSFLIIPTISWLHYFTLVNLAIILISTTYFHLHLYRIWLIIFLMFIGYAMIAFHPNYAFMIELFGQGYVTRLLTSLPLIGTCLLLCINLALYRNTSIYR